MGNDYRPKFTYSDMDEDLTASPMVSMTNGRGVGWAKYVRGVRNNLRLRLAWRSMTGAFMSTIALYVLKGCMVWEILCDRVASRSMAGADMGAVEVDVQCVGKCV